MINLKTFNKFPNVGDVLSVEICKHYFSDNITQLSGDETASPNLLLIGSILEWADSDSLVCGPGFIKKESKLKCKPKLITGVRGKLTSEIIQQQGIADIKRLGDPGLLINNLYENNTKPRYKIGLVPHYVDKQILSDMMARQTEEVSIIDVFLSPEEFSIKIQECELILSSSLHGLVIAHAYGIPAHWIELSNNVLGNGFKFYDYYSSLGVPIEEVKRTFLKPNTDLSEVSKLATKEEIGDCVNMLEESIYEARKILLN